MIILTGYCHNCNQYYAHRAIDAYDETARHICKELLKGSDWVGTAADPMEWQRNITGFKMPGIK